MEVPLVMDKYVLGGDGVSLIPVEPQSKKEEPKKDDDVVTVITWQDLERLKQWQRDVNARLKSVEAMFHELHGKFFPNVNTDFEELVIQTLEKHEHGLRFNKLATICKLHQQELTRVIKHLCSTGLVIKGTGRMGAYHLTIKE